MVAVVTEVLLVQASLIAGNATFAQTKLSICGALRDLILLKCGILTLKDIIR